MKQEIGFDCSIISVASFSLWDLESSMSVRSFWAINLGKNTQDEMDYVFLSMTKPFSFSNWCLFRKASVQKSEFLVRTEEKCGMLRLSYTMYVHTIRGFKELKFIAFRPDLKATQSWQPRFEISPLNAQWRLSICNPKGKSIWNN